MIDTAIKKYSKSKFCKRKKNLSENLQFAGDLKSCTKQRCIYSPIKSL